MKLIIPINYLLIAILFISGCSLTENSSDTELSETELKAEANKYLNSKYAMEMEVVGTEEYGFDQKKVIASPVRSDLTFSVNYHGYGNEPNDNGPAYKASKFTDRYQETVWKKQISEQIKPIIQTEYSNARVEANLEKAHEVDKRNYNVPFADTEVYITKAYDKESDLPKIMRIVKQFKTNGYTEGSLRIEYNKEVFQFSTNEFPNLNEPRDLTEYQNSKS